MAKRGKQHEGQGWPKEQTRDAARLRDDLAWFEARRAGLPVDGFAPPATAIDRVTRIREELEADGTRPASWNQMPKDRFLLFAWQQILALAADQDRSAGNERTGRMPDLYGAVQARLSVAERLRMLEQLALQCDRLGFAAGNLLTPFLFIEADDGVFSTTVITLASHTPPPDGTPDRPGIVAGTEMALLLRHVLPPPRQGLLVGALLQLGDRRTLPAIEEAWPTLPPGASQGVNRAPSGILFASHVEFYLRLMEATDEDGFGVPAAGLVSMIRSARVPFVLDVERDVPPATPDADPIREIARWDIPAFAARIEPRLRALLARETTEKVIPFVLEAWGLPWEPETEEERQDHERRGRLMGLGRSPGRPPRFQA